MSLSYHVYRFASNVRHKLLRRLTPAGLLVLAGTLAAASASLDMDRSMGYQALGLLLCLLVTANVGRRGFRLRFQASRTLPRLASVGQPFRYSVQVRNIANKSYRGLELFDELADPRPTKAQYDEWRRPTEPLRHFRLQGQRGPRQFRNLRRALVSPSRLPILPAHGMEEVTMEILPLRRGPLRFEAVSLARSDPLGLARSFIRTPAPDTVMVLPRRYPVPEISFVSARRHQPGGVAMASNVGASEEFVSLRDYRPGDPVRHIHWRSWARLGRPIVREFQDEFFPRHALVLDTVATASQDQAFEEAVSVAASFACTLDTQESLLDLLFVGPKAIQFTAGRCLAQMEQALEVLASVERCPNQSFDVLHRLVLEHAPKVCGCICVFVNWDEPRRELVRQLRSSGVPVLALVIAASRTEQMAGGSAPGVYFLQPGRIAQGISQVGPPS